MFLQKCLKAKMALMSKKKYKKSENFKINFLMNINISKKSIHVSIKSSSTLL